MLTLRIVLLLLVTLALVGCGGTWYGRVETGASFNPGIQDTQVIQQRFSSPISLVRTTTSLVREFPIVQDVYIDLGAGPSFSFPWDGNAPALGVQYLVRPRVVLGCVEPYLYVGNGFEWATERWHSFTTQGTPWGFTLEMGVGARWHAFGGTWFTMDYRFFHESNGSKIFGSPEPNKGFNSDMVYIGMEFEL